MLKEEHIEKIELFTKKLSDKNSELSLACKNEDKEKTVLIFKDLIRIKKEMFDYVKFLDEKIMTKEEKLLWIRGFNNG